MDRQAIQQETSLEIEPIVPNVRAAALYAWRLAQLQRAGYDAFAGLLAENRTVDLHVACDLRKNGCPAHTAYLILS